jgi:hypothetical protein
VIEPDDRSNLAMLIGELLNAAEGAARFAA